MEDSRRYETLFNSDIKKITKEILMELYHYFDKKTGPFKNLSDVSIEEANEILNDIKIQRPNVQSAQRHVEYMESRHYYENLMRNLFIQKGGKVVREVPHYMVIGHSPWLSTWFDNCDFIKIPIEEFDIKTLSFTYGDSHPTFSPRIKDGKEYRKQLYFYDEILEIIERYGLPQNWNDDGRFGPERYVEVHVWSDETISKYRY